MKRPARTGIDAGGATARQRSIRTTTAFAVGAALVFLLGAAPSALGRDDPNAAAPMCAERAAAGPGEGWVCADAETVKVAATGAPRLAREGRTRIAPDSFSAGNVSSDWTWNWSEVVYYGIGTRTIGSIRVVASLNLNGRQAQSSWQISKFSGPSIIGRPKVRCLDDNSPTWLPDTVCDESWVYQTTYTTSPILNKSAPYLSEDERYWFEYSAWYKANGESNPSTSDGYWRIPNQPALSAAFSCSSSRSATKVCIFG